MNLRFRHPWAVSVCLAFLVAVSVGATHAPNTRQKNPDTTGAAPVSNSQLTDEEAYTLVFRVLTDTSASAEATRAYAQHVVLGGRGCLRCSPTPQSITISDDELKRAVTGMLALATDFQTDVGPLDEQARIIRERTKGQFTIADKLELERLQLEKNTAVASFLGHMRARLGTAAANVQIYIDERVKTKAKVVRR